MTHSLAFLTIGYYILFICILLSFSFEFWGYMHRVIYFEKSICNLFLTLI